MRDFHFSLDRGGTFTDLFALVPDGKGGTEHRVLKLLSEDPTNYPDAPREGIRRVLEAVTGVAHPRDKPLCTERIASIRMGTTVATNALLERKGERVALVVTAGFPDLLHIGNQSRPHIFDLEIRCPDTLYERVVEVDELVVLPLGDIPNTRNGREAATSCKLYPPGGPVTKAVTGEAVCIRKPPDLDKLRTDLQAVLDAGIRSLAVVLKHAAIFPDHELAVGELARTMGFTHVSLSSVVMPMVRMVPRGFTAAADAYLTPHIMRYIHTFQAGFDEGLKDVQLLFMQSDGGLSQVDHFSGHKAILSGPAGGYVGYARTTQWDGMPPGQLQVIGFDMGGTSTDVSRYAGSYAHVFETVTAGVNIQAPQLDINTVAAGGGSRLFFRAGAFSVGPESAGAHPGPVAYRKGGHLAITDANLVLGRILPDFFPKIFGPGEDQPLDVEGARSALEALTAEVNAYASGTSSSSSISSAADGGSTTAKSVDEVAMGFVAVANEAMCRPIRALTQMKGFDASAHVLACFGGAGGQHACAIARALGMSTIFVHRYAGILSAVGIRLAEVVAEAQEPCAAALTGPDADAVPEARSRARGETQAVEAAGVEGLEAKLARLEAAAREKLRMQGFEQADIHTEHFLNLRYEGTDVAVMTSTSSSSSSDAQDGLAAEQGAHTSASASGRTDSSHGNVDGLHGCSSGRCNGGSRSSKGGIASAYASAFTSQYQREFGFTLDRPILVDDLRVRATGRSASLPAAAAAMQTPGPLPDPVATASAYFEIGGRQPTPAYQLSSLTGGHEIPGPAIIIDSISTIVVEPACTAHITADGNVRIVLGETGTNQSNASAEDIASAPADPITLAIFSHRFMGIAEQMGRTLQRTSISVNIKERLDFSCALFGPDGSLVANAPHLPVHLGAMSEAVKFQVRYYSAGGPGETEGLREGDVLMSNHPQLAGGSHLPDITVITPVFRGGKIVFFVASRGHHADIGGISPGSMPPASKVLAEEGAAVVSFKLVRGGHFQEAGVTELLQAPGLLADNIPGCTGTRNLSDNLSDLRAQVAANTRGIQLVGDLIQEYSLPMVQAYMRHIQANAEAAVREMLREFSLAQGLPEVGSVTSSDIMDDGSPICLAVTIDRRDGSALFDFAGTGPEVYGNCNAPPAVAYSAIIYSLRCLVRREIPLNQGCLAPVTITIPPNCLLNPSETAAVVGGNVLTSQRVTDVVLKAFGAAAASQGCMNNFTFGDEGMGYYETIAGGAGAGPHWHGRSGVHTHMTNTRITDPEVFERRYPVVLHGFHLRKGSGGNGKWRGGDGVVREVEFLRPMDAGILSERRAVRPFGLFGGESGQAGLNLLIRASGRVINLGGKATVRVEAGDRIKLLTPGAGGYGAAPGGTSDADGSTRCTAVASMQAQSARAVGQGNQADAGTPSAQAPQAQHQQHHHVHKGSVYEYTARQEGA